MYCCHHVFFSLCPGFLCVYLFQPGTGCRCAAGTPPGKYQSAMQIDFFFRTAPGPSIIHWMTLIQTRLIRFIAEILCASCLLGCIYRVQVKTRAAMLTRHLTGIKKRAEKNDILFIFHLTYVCSRLIFIKSFLWFLGIGIYGQASISHLFRFFPTHHVLSKR